MNTPITDGYKGRWATHFPDGITIYDIARRLELDRAALMDFLAKLDEMANDDEFGSSDFRKTCRYDIPQVIAAARANFP